MPRYIAWQLSCARWPTHGFAPFVALFVCRVCSSWFSSKAALIALGYEEVALDDFWQTFLQELDALPNMEMGQLEVRRRIK